jgi:hypothetical protein
METGTTATTTTYMTTEQREMHDTVARPNSCFLLEFYVYCKLLSVYYLLACCVLTLNTTDALLIACDVLLYMLIPLLHKDDDVMHNYNT